MSLNIITRQALVQRLRMIWCCTFCIFACMISACASVTPSAASGTKVRPISPSSTPPSLETCPVTQPPTQPFTPPALYPSKAPSGFWYGTPSLWIDMPHDGTWPGLLHNPEGYTQKVFWWHEGYSPTKEPFPNLSVSGQRLDASAPPLNVSQATNASGGDIYLAMLVGVDFPTFGCWQITGRYADAELTFVVRVAP